MHLKLMKIELITFSSQSDRQVAAAATTFNELRTRYSSQQPPQDQRCEQDVWIPWIAQQSGEGTRNIFVTHVLNRTVLANHLVDIGLAARGTVGGRLNSDISDSRMSKPGDIMSTREPHQQLIVGARSEAGLLPMYWARMFLFD